MERDLRGMNMFYLEGTPSLPFFTSDAPVTGIVGKEVERREIWSMAHGYHPDAVIVCALSPRWMVYFRSSAQPERVTPLLSSQVATLRQRFLLAPTARVASLLERAIAE